MNLDGCCLVLDVGLVRFLFVLSVDCYFFVIGIVVCRLLVARDKKVRIGVGFVFLLDEGYYYVENWIVYNGRRLLGIVNNEK